jgi:hypothetical protein
MSDRVCPPARVFVSRANYYGWRRHELQSQIAAMTSPGSYLTQTDLEMLDVWQRELRQIELEARRTYDY